MITERITLYYLSYITDRYIVSYDKNGRSWFLRDKTTGKLVEFSSEEKAQEYCDVLNAKLRKSNE